MKIRIKPISKEWLESQEREEINKSREYEGPHMELSSYKRAIRKIKRVIRRVA